MTNEITTVNNQNGAYEISKNETGKFVRKAIYQPFSSVVAETREQKINLMNLLNSDDVAQPLSENTGKQFKISDIIFQPYDKVNEDTGEMEFGCLTYMITNEGIPYVTSSKSVYYTLKQMFLVFGEPHWTEDEQPIVEVVKKKGKQFNYTDLKIVG